MEQTMDKNVTILLVLKDRPHYTLRFLKYMDLLKSPYKILIADGGRHPTIPQILQNKQNFPNLNYEYVRYPYDHSLDDFHEKMASVVQKIDTPTVIAMDNDDFILSEGIAKCLVVLKENNSYSSARGAIHRIDISHDIYGHMTLGKNMYTKYPNSIIEQTAANRVREQTKRFHSNWHNVTRSNHFKTAWRMINVVKPQNMRFTEQLICYLNVLWGDGFRSDFFWLLHQQGQRIEINGASLDSHFLDQEAWIKSDYWLEEFNKMTEAVAVAMSDLDGIPIEKSLEIFAETYPLKLPHLKSLLEVRIKEAVDLGYNTERIKKLFKIVKEHDIKNIEPIADISDGIPARQEIEFLTNYLIKIARIS